MKKIFLLTVLFLVFSGNNAFASFKNLPAFGVCTATNVRIREDPDTSSATRVVARLDNPERVIVLSQTYVDGEIWYEIDMSQKNYFDEHEDDYESVETAFVYGQFISPLYDDDMYDENLIKLLMHLNRNSIRNPNADYDKGWLINLRITKGTIMPNSLKIKDSSEKLTNFLGKPDKRNGDILTYRADENTFFDFVIKNNHISEMILRSKI